jgi:hypothetical protein
VREPTDAQLRGAVLHGIAQSFATCYLEDVRAFAAETYRLLDELEAKETAGEALTDAERLELERDRHAAGLLDRDGGFRPWVLERYRKSTQRSVIELKETGVWESTVRGYRVRTHLRTPENAKERRAAVGRVLAQAAVRRARESGEA